MSSHLLQSSWLKKTENFLVVNKPAKTHYDELVDPQLWQAVHRLDYETSGCLLLSKPELWPKYRTLFQADSKSLIDKRYVCGVSLESLSSDRLYQPSSSWKDELGFIASRYRSSKKTKFVLSKDGLGGWHSVKPVQHRWRLLEAKEHVKFSAFEGELIEIELITGARHQIRAFFANLGHPLMGDPVYGQEAARLELHAWKLSFVDPMSEEKIQVEAPLI